MYIDICTYVYTQICIFIYTQMYIYIDISADVLENFVADFVQRALDVHLRHVPDGPRLATRTRERLSQISKWLFL